MYGVLSCRPWSQQWTLKSRFTQRQRRSGADFKGNFKGRQLLNGPLFSCTALLSFDLPIQIFSIAVSPFRFLVKQIVPLPRSAAKHSLKNLNQLAECSLIFRIPSSMVQDYSPGCWPSSVAHTHILIPSHSPPKPISSSENEQIDIPTVWTPSVAHTHIIPQCAPLACWTSTVAHTHMLIPPYSPPKPKLLSEKEYHDPKPWSAASCHLGFTHSACATFDVDLLLTDDRLAANRRDCNPGDRFELDNEINILFAKHNFHGVRYEVVEPALRLASLLLETPCLMQYWYAAFFSLQNFPSSNNPTQSYEAIARKTSAPKRKRSRKSAFEICRPCTACAFLRFTTIHGAWSFRSVLSRKVAIGSGAH